MGLDSIELVVAFEDYFQIEIPDHEAVKMATIVDAANFISTKISYVDHQSDIKSDVLMKMNEAFLKVGKILPNPKDKIFNTIDFDDIETWKSIFIEIGYQFPELTNSSQLGKFIDKLIPKKIQTDPSTLSRFIDLICAVNYQDILIKGQIQNKYEVEIAVIGITIEKIGVSPFEVFNQSSFTKDLGVD